MSEFVILQTLSMKGSATASLLAQVTGAPPPELAAVISRSVIANSVVIDDDEIRLTATGRDKLQEMLASERAAIDLVALKTLYSTFRLQNARLKQTITDWQLSGGVTSNDYSGRGHDEVVLGDLTLVDADVASLMTQIAALVPRLERYSDRLACAHRKLAAGDYRYIANAGVDSYHQIWFELHQELIDLLGQSRQAEE
jgi:hypothetical protein